MKLSVLLILILLLSVSGCGDSDPPQPLAVDPVAEAQRSQHEIRLSASYVAEGSDENEIDAPKQKPLRWIKEELVKRNCYIVRDAVEALAAENGGLYPQCVSCPGLSGKDLLDFLPGEIFLMNPFTGVHSEPQSAHAGRPGEIGYVSALDRHGRVTAYRIDGWGATGAIIAIEKSGLTERGEIVIIPPSKEDLGAD